MPIPEGQLDTWSGRGKIGEFVTTYNHLKATLEDPASPYARASRQFRVFRQGSYENHTNVWADSDVDVVMMLTSTFHYNLNELSDQEKVNFRAAYPNDATYLLADFKRDVIAWLEHNYPGSIDPGGKAVHIAPNSKLPRKADVLVSTIYKDYWGFATVADTESFIPGVRFYDKNNNSIINYPEVHSQRCTDKHADTGDRFKPTVRILKNMRNRMIDEKLLADGVAPSYYIEGLLSNVPEPNFVARHDATFVNCMKWLSACDRNALRCAHRMRPLIGEGRATAWPLANCNTFITALIDYWNDWYT
jgi:hypothetical protein